MNNKRTINPFKLSHEKTLTWQASYQNNWLKHFFVSYSTMPFLMVLCSNLKHACSHNIQKCILSLLWQLCAEWQQGPAPFPIFLYCYIIWNWQPNPPPPPTTHNCLGAINFTLRHTRQEVVASFLQVHISTHAGWVWCLDLNYSPLFCIDHVLSFKYSLHLYVVRDEIFVHTAWHHLSDVPVIVDIVQDSTIQNWKEDKEVIKKTFVSHTSPSKFALTSVR